MDTTLQKHCERFIHNRDVLRKIDPVNGLMVCPVAAGMLTAASVTAEREHLKACEKILAQRAGIFSNFRSYARLPVICILAAAEDPEQTMDRASAFYKELKTVFRGSSVLPVTALILAVMLPGEDAAPCIGRAREIYKLMKEKHPVLTGSEDTPNAVLLAFSEKPNEQLIDEMEQVIADLKGEGFSSNSVQSIAQIFALTPGNAGEKCARFRKLFDDLKARGSKYSRSSGLGALAGLAVLPVQTEVLEQELIDVADWLSGQKGYGFFGYGAKTRRMHAAMILNGFHAQEEVKLSAGGSGRAVSPALMAVQNALLSSAIMESMALTVGTTATYT